MNQLAKGVEKIKALLALIVVHMGTHVTFNDLDFNDLSAMRLLLT